jgi:hydroxymethylglutaryl-CoA lyase
MFEALPASIQVVEVGPRDGLQNEAAIIPTEAKLKLIEALAASGLTQIEITSFVSPKWIPQLADGPELARLVMQTPHLAKLQTSALVPNLKGYAAAKEAGLKQVNLFMSASESHSKKNINKSIAEALSTLAEVAQVAKADGKRVRCYVSTVFACPYEGKIAPQASFSICLKLLAMGVDEISLGDTIGAATPDQVVKLIAILSGEMPLDKLALHFHDTRGGALANVVAGIESGITIFDASVGGLGGCPYAPGASGNLATEDLIYMLSGMGIDTGVDLEKLTNAGLLAQEMLGRPLPGRYLKARLAERAQKVAS